MIAAELPPLDSLRDAAWNLEDFVAEVNTRLPAILPSDTADARQREDFSVRLLRHYASLGLVDESERVGREARYRYRHLLQVLSLRRLQRQGWNSKAIGDFVGRDNTELETFLLGQIPAQGAAKLEAEEVAAPDLADAAVFAERAPATPERAKKVAAPEAPRREASPRESALEFLAQIRQIRSRGAPAPAATPAPSQSLPAPSPLPQFLLHDPPKAPERWQRIELAPGLELHVSDRYRRARTAADKARLRDALETALETEPTK